MPLKSTKLSNRKRTPNPSPRFTITDLISLYALPYILNIPLHSYILRKHYILYYSPAFSLSSGYLTLPILLLFAELLIAEARPWFFSNALYTSTSLARPPSQSPPLPHPTPPRHASPRPEADPVKISTILLC